MHNLFYLFEIMLFSTANILEINAITLFEPLDLHSIISLEINLYNHKLKNLYYLI
jgi:hypothetical protein